jgi:hypothetical protein
MDHAVPRPDHRQPGDIGMFLLILLGYAVSCLANYFN